MGKIENWSRNEELEDGGKLFWEHDELEDVTASIVERSDLVSGDRYVFSVLDERSGKEAEMTPVSGDTLSEVKDDARDWLKSHPMPFAEFRAEQLAEELEYSGINGIPQQDGRKVYVFPAGMNPDGERIDNETIDEVGRVADQVVGEDGYDMNVARGNDEITITIGE